jgi:hypothetical protein
MKRICIIGTLILLFMIFSKLSEAQPDFSGAFKEHGVVLFRDIKKQNVFYYLPGDLEIARSAGGKPDLSFIMMRYTGSAVYGENEEIRYRNILSMRLVMKNVMDDSLRLAKAKLNVRSMVVFLKPLPITMIDAMIVFIPVGGSDSTAVIKKGSLSAEGNPGYSSSGTYWQERYFTIYLDNHSTNLLLEASRKDYMAMSFMYAFYSKGKSNKSITDFSGHSQLAGMFRNQLAENESDTADTLRECVIKSNAFAIHIDTVKYPEMIRQIDINNGVPPGYAVLNVRNYDFANNLRNDLYEKTVDLEATGAGGGKVQSSVTFRSSAPDITSTNFKFRYAVRLDKPYRYRVRELYNDGREEVTEWKDITMWSGLLDVTTRKN